MDSYLSVYLMVLSYLAASAIFQIQALRMENIRLENARENSTRIAPSLSIVVPMIKLLRNWAYVSTDTYTLKSNSAYN